MAPRLLLDTKICIYIRQKRPDEVLRRFRKLRAGEAALSVITYGELMYGAEKSAKREAAGSAEGTHHLAACTADARNRGGDLWFDSSQA